jgi:ankyrin repeat protein
MLPLHQKMGESQMTDSEKLFALLESGNFALFKKVASCSPAIRVFCDKNGDFLLHRAVSLGSLVACKYLLKRDIPATCPGSRGATPLHYAAQKGYEAIMEILLQATGTNHSPINANGMTPLHVAAGEGQLEIVNMLIDKGADTGAQDKFGRLPLHYAAGTDQIDVIRCLVGRNSRQIDLSDAFGQRPIHWARQFECIHAVDWLERQGVDLKSRDIYGRTPLYFLRYSVEATSRKLSKDDKTAMASIGMKTSRLTPFQRAIFHGDINQVKQLMSKQATLNRKGDLGRTPLHIAAFAKNRDIYRWMQREGAKTDIVDDYGWTPFKLLSYRLITGKSPNH